MRRARRAMAGVPSAASLVFVLLLAACVHSSPGDVEVQARACPPVAVVAGHLASWQGETGVEGMFKVTLETAQGKRRLEGALLAQVDEGLRVELLTLVGPPVAHIAVSLRRASLYLPMSDSLFLDTNAPDRVLARLTGGAIDTRAFIGLFLGRLPRCKVGDTVRYAAQADRFEVDCTSSEGQAFRLGLQPETLQVIYIAGMVENPSETFAFDLGDYRPVGTGRLPFRMRLRFGESVRADIRFTSMIPRDAIDAGLFVLAPPEGARVVSLESVLPPR